MIHTNKREDGTWMIFKDGSYCTEKEALYLHQDGTWKNTVPKFFFPTEDSAKKALKNSASR